MPGQFISIIIICGVLAAYCAAIWLYTLIARLRSNRIDRLMHLYEKGFQECAGDCSQEAACRLLPVKAFPYFTRYLRNFIDNNPKAQLCPYGKAAAASGYFEYLLKRIKSRQQWKRAVALRTLSYFCNDANRSVFRKALAQEKFYPAIFAAAMGLAGIGDMDSLELIIRKMYSRKVFNREHLAAVLVRYGEQSAPELLRILGTRTLPAAAAGVAVRMLGFFRYEPARELLEDMLRNADDQGLRINLAEAIGYIGGASTCRLLYDCLQDRNFRVRIKAVNSMAYIGKPCSIPIIADMLNDRVFWVRRNAAEALYWFGSEGRKVLKEIAAGENDRASETAQLILSEMMFNRERWRYKHAEFAS